MSVRPDIQLTSETEIGLRPTMPDEIVDYLGRRWDEEVKVILAGEGERLTVAKGWHGEGKTGQAMVLFGPALTEPISGTALPPGALTEWLERVGFRLSVYGKEASREESAQALGSDGQPSSSGEPIFRAVRTHEQGLPVSVEFYAGSCCQTAAQLSQLGNRQLKPNERGNYRGVVYALMRPFLGKKISEAQAEMGLPSTMRVIRRVDDCAAAMTTIAGDQEVDSALWSSRKGIFDVVDVAVATTQAAVIAIWRASERGVPLILRAGVPSFGLGDEETGLNYMLNVQPEMRAHGRFTAGDMGVNMSDGLEATLKPHAYSVGDGGGGMETRFYLNGGGPIRQIYEWVRRECADRTPHEVRVMGAARIDNGPEQWGVILDGIR